MKCHICGVEIGESQMDANVHVEWHRYKENK